MGRIELEQQNGGRSDGVVIINEGDKPIGSIKVEGSGDGSKIVVTLFEEKTKKKGIGLELRYL